MKPGVGKRSECFSLKNKVTISPSEVQWVGWGLNKQALRFPGSSSIPRGSENAKKSTSITITSNSDDCWPLNIKLQHPDLTF